MYISVFLSFLDSDHTVSPRRAFRKVTILGVGTITLVPRP